MMSIKTALKLVCGGTFLLIFLLTSSLDLALIIPGSILAAFFYKNYIPVFIVSAVLFLLYIISDRFNLFFRYISDLSIDAYILLILGVLLYFKSKNDFLRRCLDIDSIDNDETKSLFKKITPKIIVSIILAVLFFPVFGGPLSAIIGYIFFSVFIKKNNGKITVFIAIFILVLITFFLLFKINIIAQSLGVYAYSFLVFGTLQEIVNLVIKKKEDENKEGKEKEEITKSEIKIENFKPPRFLIFLAGGIAFIFSFYIFYFLLPRLLS